MTIEKGDAAALFNVAEKILREHYGDRPGFELRTDLAFPGASYRQANVFVGPRAGLQLRVEQKGDSASIDVRECGWLEFRLQIAAAFFGVAVTLVVFLFLFFDGLLWGRFIAGSVRYADPHFHGGAVMLYAVFPSLIAGFGAGAVTWPFSRLARPLCHAANRELKIESPAALVARLQGRMTMA